MTRKSSLLPNAVVGLVLLCASTTCSYAQRRPRVSPPSSAPATTAVRAHARESLTAIAARFEFSVEEIAQLNNLPVQSRLKKGQRILLPPTNDRRDTSVAASDRQVVGNRISFVDGTTLDVEEAWKQGNVTWYKRGGVMQSLERPVQAIEPLFAAKPTAKLAKTDQGVAHEAAGDASRLESVIFLVGGARFKVDEVYETSEGAWYSRGNLSVFLERSRIARITKEDPFSSGRGWKNSDWSSGNSRIDELIKTNGHHYGVDPYLVFCVIEHESHFQSRALSPKGARGLMQLMPGTARRFGVRNSFDVAENIKGGTQYLRELMDMFDGRVSLVLASYNAGEGAVMKYGRNVPPYRETREYVKRIGRRYGLAGRDLGSDNEVPAPRE